MIRRSFFLVIASAGLVAGCSGLGGERAALPPAATQSQSVAQATPTLVGKYIKHVVIIVQENRSFENFFAGYPGADAPMSGRMVLDDPNPKATTVPLHAIGFDECEVALHEPGCDLAHSYGNAITDYDGGKMDGFGKPYLSTGQQIKTYAYAYVERSEVAPYWTMARRYVLADHMFPTEFGPSFTGHLFLISSSDSIAPGKAVVNLPDGQPWGCSAPAGTTVDWITPQLRTPQTPGVFPCFTQWKTLADTLDEKRLDWKYYAPALSAPDGSGAIWSTFDAIKDVCQPSGRTCTGAHWKTNVVSPQTEVLAAPSKASFPSVAWVIPDYADSDHSENGKDTGPSWVAAVINEIGKSKYWKSTAIFVVWDDWGGWYDNIPPPQKDYLGLGIRVPFLIVSPYAKKGFVSHTVYEFGSIVRFVNETFGLPALGPAGQGYTDTRAHPLDDSFDFTQKPRAFEKIPAKYPASYFLKEKPSLRVPDEE